MTQRFLAAFGAAFLFLSAGALQAEDDAMAIIDKAIKANGGAEELGKAKAEQWKTKGTINILDMKLAYTGDYYFQRPNLLRFDIAMDFNGMKAVISAASDGTTAWEKFGDEVRDMEKKKRDAFMHNAYAMSLTQLLPLKEKEYTLALADEIKIDDKPAAGVTVSSKGHADVTLWFDKATGLLAKTKTSVWNEFTDADVPQEVFITDYFKKDGHMYFKKLVIKRDGKPFIEEEFSEQKQMEKLDPKLFAKP